MRFGADPDLGLAAGLGCWLGAPSSTEEISMTLTPMSQGISSSGSSSCELDVCRSRMGNDVETGLRINSTWAAGEIALDRGLCAICARTSRG